MTVNDKDKLFVFSCSDPNHPKSLGKVVTLTESLEMVLFATKCHLESRRGTATITLTRKHTLPVEEKKP